MGMNMWKRARLGLPFLDDVRTPRPRAFNVAERLGIPSDGMPEEREGYVALRVPDGISLCNLRDKAYPALKASCKVPLNFQDFYRGLEWAINPVPAGDYYLHMKVMDSNGKSFAEQRTMLMANEKPIPVTLAVLALMCDTEEDLYDGIVRCEETYSGFRIGVMKIGRLYIHIALDVETDPSDFVWIGAASGPF